MIVSRKFPRIETHTLIMVMLNTQPTPFVAVAIWTLLNEHVTFQYTLMYEKGKINTWKSRAEYDFMKYRHLH